MRRFAIHFQDNGAFQNIDEPRRRMRVTAGRRTGRDSTHPDMHCFVPELRQICLKKIGAFDWRLLGNPDLSAYQAQRYSAR
ncbi:MAG TPA: hypothetical protein VGF16_15225 [Bryobacteraceae bacterium]